MDTPPFVPGLELAEGFFHDHVEHALRDGFPSLRYSAALIGDGSEVLGFDTPVSTDHHWGPRLMLFLSSRDYGERREEIVDHLARSLPPLYRGHATHFSPPDPNDHGVRRVVPYDGGPVNHMVEVLTIESYFRRFLEIDAFRPPTPAEWLSLPSQKLRSVTAGAVFRDELGLQSVRAMLAWYPPDVHLYVLGSLWTRIGQEEHLMGRAGQVGDELGSALIGGRLARDVMRIAFVLERQYAPYPKWFGTAFGRLRCADRLAPSLRSAVTSRTWTERQTALADAYEAVLRVQRESGLQDGGRGRVRFFGRPFLVIKGGEIAAEVFARIEDPLLRSLAGRRPIGSIDAMSDSTDVLESAEVSSMARALYRG